MQFSDGDLISECNTKVVNSLDRYTEQSVFASISTKGFKGFGSFHRQSIQHLSQISSAESQKGVNIVERRSIENQKGTVTIDFVQQ